MSFIHYKLITNKNFEKITFDGVSLSVYDLKKIILEKKFRKQIATSSSNQNGTMPNKKSVDVDLEVTNADSNEVYQRDTDLIPKNSRVRINRVVKSIGPAIAGGTITSTQKQKEQLVNLRQRFNNYSNYSSPNASPVRDYITQGDSKVLNDTENSIYSDFIGNDESNSNSSNSISFSSESINLQSLSATETISPLVTGANVSLDDNKRSIAQKIKVTIPSQQINDSVKAKDFPAPPVELLCPFMDETKSLHLIDNAVIVPCCGYFICCEECIRDVLEHNNVLECPHKECIQEITSNHRLTPYKPIRQKVIEYLTKNPEFTKLDTPPPNMITIKSKESASNDLTSLQQQNSPSFTPVKINLPGIKAEKSPETTELSLDTLPPEVELTVTDRSRSRSTSSTRTSSKTSRSRSNSSTTSHESSKSSVAADRSCNTPISDETVLTPVKVEDEFKSEKVSETTELVNGQSQVFSQQTAQLNLNQPPPTTQQFNVQPQYYNQQQQHVQMGHQGFYQNQQTFAPAQMNQCGFNNFSKQLPPPPGTENFIQTHFPQGQFHTQINYDQRYNQNFQQQYHNMPPHLAPNGYIQNQFQANGHFQNQFSQQWNHQIPQPGIINAPITIPSRQQYSSSIQSRNQRHYYSSKYESNRSRSRSRSRRSGSVKKHKRRYSRSRSRSKKRRSRSSSRNRRRYDRRRGSSRDHRSRTRSCSRSDYREKSSKDKSDLKAKELKVSKRDRSRSMESERRRTKHSKKRSRSEKKEDRSKKEKNGTAKTDNKEEKSSEISVQKISDEVTKVNKKSTSSNKIDDSKTDSKKLDVIKEKSQEESNDDDVKKCNGNEQYCLKSNGIKVNEEEKSPIKKQIIISNINSTPPSSTCSSPCSSPKKSKRKVFLKQNIYQQAHKPSPQTNSIKQLTSHSDESVVKPLKNKDVNIEEKKLVSSLSNCSNYSNGINSESDAVNEDEDFLDINISDHLNLSLA